MLDLQISHSKAILCERLLENIKWVMFKWTIPDRLIDLNKVILRKTINKIFISSQMVLKSVWSPS